MYCQRCYGNDAYPAHDVNRQRLILICPKCGEVSWQVQSIEELAKDVERIKERTKGIRNMPEVEE